MVSSLKTQVISVYLDKEPKPGSVNLNVESHDLMLMLWLEEEAYEMWILC